LKTPWSDGTSHVLLSELVTYTGVLAPAAHASWIPWSELLKRTFGVDALACACGGRLKVRAVVHPDRVRGSWNAPKLFGVVGYPAAQTAWVAARAPPSDEVWC